MGCCLKLAAFFSLAMAIGFAYFWHTLDAVPDIPEIEDTYWAEGSPKPDNPAIKPFKIAVPQSDLDDLMRRLDNTRELRPPLEGIGFQYGINTNYVNSLVAFWKKEYKWKEREAFLNQFPQFKTQISGLNIHFLHVKPDKSKLKPGQEVIPLLILHGWPGSVREFYELIPMLVTPRADENFVFEVIAPSLPGYGFSDGASKPGLGFAQVAVIMRKLMQRLGFEKYYIQGGDWGSAVGKTMSILYPESVHGFHSNMCISHSRKVQLKMILGSFMPSLFSEEGYENRFSQLFSFMLEETGYMHLQASKPDTVGVALTDSPAGLAAYILEKFSTWTNPLWRQKMDGGLSNYKMENLLDNVMIYWLSKSITTSMRLYSESINKKHMSLGVDRAPVNIPTGCARFPGDLLYMPRSFIKETHPKLLRLTDMPKGGHFAAFEVPDLLAEDVWNFVHTVRTKPLPGEEL